MTVAMKGPEEKYGVSFIDIRSQCLHIPSMSVEVLEDLRRGSLRSYLECSAKVIEQLLCFSTTSSTNFSWRLPRNLYPSKANPEKSLYFSEEESVQKKMMEIPMKILDDLAICEQRAMLRAEPHLGNQPTVMEELGKKWWREKADSYRRAVENLFGGEHVKLLSNIEHYLSLYYISTNFVFKLNGVADLVTIFSIHCKSKITENVYYVPTTILFEFTLYRRIESIISRVVAYASGLYSEYGFLTVPIVLIVDDFENDIIERAVLLLNNNKAGFVSMLKNNLSRLEKLLGEESRPRIASKEVCRQCDLDIRNRCPYAR